jgi:hypothetical protein
VREDRRLRRLVVGEETWLWSVRHRHAECREVLSLHRAKVSGGGTLRVVFRFRAGTERFVADGLWHQGLVANADGDSLNLHEPGVVRLLLDAAVGADAPVLGRGEVEIDGWPLFDVLVSR